jgi:hypothetical protein
LTRYQFLAKRDVMRFFQAEKVGTGKRHAVQNVTAAAWNISRRRRRMTGGAHVW